MARRRRPPQPPVEDNRAGLDRRSGTLDSRVVRRSRKPWIGVLVATFTMASIPVARAVTDQAPTPLPPPVAGKTVNAAGQGREGPLPAARHQRVRRAHRSAAAPDRDDLRHHGGPRDADLGQRHAGRDPARLVLRGHLHPGPDDGIEADHDAGARRGAAQLPQGVARPEPAPARSASRAICGATARAASARSGRFGSATVRGTRWVVLRPLRRDADPRRARLRHGARPVRNKTVVPRGRGQYLARRAGSATP